MCVNGSLIKLDPIIGQKARLSKFQKIAITQILYSLYIYNIYMNSLLCILLPKYIYSRNLKKFETNKSKTNLKLVCHPEVN